MADRHYCPPIRTYVPSLRNIGMGIPFLNLFQAWRICHAAQGESCASGCGQQNVLHGFHVVSSRVDVFMTVFASRAEVPVGVWEIRIDMRTCEIQHDS
jgi:hypothetical protein